MQFSASELAKKINGSITGDGEVKIERPSKIEEGQKGSVSFIANSKYLQYIETTKCSVLIVSNDEKIERTDNITLIRVDDPHNAFAAVLKIFDKRPKSLKGIHPSAIIDTTAEIGKGVCIGPNVYIGPSVQLGDEVEIGPNVSVLESVQIGPKTKINAGVQIYHDCEIGTEVIIHAGTIIGSDGFGFASANEGYDKVPQIGNVQIEDQVEIGANCTIDRATIGSTIIKKGAKLDNLIQVAHNVIIGENTVIAAQTGISGSTKLGKNCMIGGQVGFVGHIELADGTMIAAQSGVGKGTKSAGVWSGSPAIPHQENKKSFLVYKQLPDIYKRLKVIEDQLKD